MKETLKIFKNPLFWVPTLYLAEGIPYNLIVGGTASRMYKSLGYGDAQITVALGSIGIAWSLKPLWAAFLDMYRTKKFFVLTMELLLAVMFGAISMTLPFSNFFQVSIAMFWVAAFASSTQDICADGIYLTSLDKKGQASMAGIQGTFWNIGKIITTGVLVSALDKARIANDWSQQKMWHLVMLVAGVAMAVLFVYHFFRLPKGSVTDRPESAKAVVRDFFGTAASFFHKRMFWGMIAFVFLYRLGEGLIIMEGPLFLQSPVDKGGLGLTAGDVATIEAIYGVGVGLAGGLLGGLFISRFGLSKVIGVLGLCLNIPLFTYVYLSQAAAGGHHVSYTTTVVLVSIQYFGYNFGFIGNMIYMMQQLAPGRTTMTHYAFATALMQLVMVPTNMISGPLAEKLGFSTYFLVVMLAAIPSVLAAWRAPFPRKQDPASTSSGTEEEHKMITADDHSLLNTVQLAAQRIAGRSSIYAMLTILVILIFDARILGSLQGAAEGTGQLQFGLLIASAALKLFLIYRTFTNAKQASVEAGSDATALIYVRNGRGAKIAALICAVVSVGVLVFAYKQAF
jgi:PAT family beta-lactamase induction signal transducer AmpG